ncbi:hypothetical protein N657DRAFT_464573 [Parathielavia appendiculata]|uniref:Uncharacterized protein n=1 Tax=Parathielavia appendiculata TaxID=2587402 RepID=A0AAN6YXR3_9PEZI|nr:hypothetical protein N657DRAFT_464573 [Parathielavia appendiculata]
MVSSKTWFLPPDFTFLPEGAIALGRVIPSPRQPTATLASLGPQSDNPTIPIPATTVLVEKGRAFAAETKRSFGFELLAKFLALASASGMADVSWSRNKSFSAVDHEVRTLDGDAFAPAALRAITRLEEVRRHIEGGRFGRRCVYVITGLRVAVDPFTVTDERASKVTGSVGGSGPVPADGVPVEAGGGLSGSNEHTSNRSYQTAPGIVFAYRLHVIRPKGEDDAEGGLFSDRTAFLTGEAGDDDEEEVGEMELVAVDVKTVRNDLDLDPDVFGNEQKLEEGDEESYVVMN